MSSTSILLPFYDDSSLIFARTMGDGLKQSGATITYAYVLDRLEGGDKVSDRQISLYLPSGPDIIISSVNLISIGLLASFDAIVFNRTVREVNEALANSEFKCRLDRPCFVAYLTGLEFFPEKGIPNRKNYDIVYLNSEDQLEFIPESANIFHVGVGHPSFTIKNRLSAPVGGKVIFATQAISPFTISGRIHIANLLVATALANPDREISIKLRHRQDENKLHSHREAFSYETLFKELYAGLPDNVTFDSGPMSDALKDSSLCISCTSTAIVDAITSGVDSMIYLSYPEHRHDPLAQPMLRMFSDSNLLATEYDIVTLNAKRPNPAWLVRNFQLCSSFDDLLSKIEEYKKKFSVHY